MVGPTQYTNEMPERNLTRKQVEGRRMMLGVSRYAIAKATGYDYSHVHKVLTGSTTSAPVLRKAWAYMDRLEAEAQPTDA